MPTSIEAGLLVLYALVVWWGATGLILVLNRRPERTYRASLIGASMLACAGMFAVVATRDMESITGALIGFTGALAIWALIEMLFLMGALVGTHREAAHSNEIEWSRFKRASLAIAHHEAALIVALGTLAVLLYGSANPTALWTFALLWLMRLSTKLNIFFGVPNTAAELLPPRISYLRSYFRTARPSAFFPASVTAAAATSLFIYLAISSPEATPLTVAAGTLLLTFAVLGLVEHLMLIAPFSSSAFWDWRTPRRASQSSSIDTSEPLGPTQCANDTGGRP
jgi:putative photosynthetic complex assembly protein 2